MKTMTFIILITILVVVGIIIVMILLFNYIVYIGKSFSHFRDSENNLIGFERNREKYRVLCALDKRFMYFFSTNVSSTKNQLELIEIDSPKRKWEIKWSEGCLLLNALDPEQIQARIVRLPDNEEVKKIGIIIGQTKNALELINSKVFSVGPDQELSHPDIVLIQDEK